jgi:hypothetical protein
LNEAHKNAPWVHQVVTMVEGAIDRAVAQLSGSSVVVNSKPIGKGGEYIMPARTAKEIAETPAADDRVVSEAISEEIDDVRDPVTEKPVAAKETEWIL